MSNHKKKTVTISVTQHKKQAFCCYSIAAEIKNLILIQRKQQKNGMSFHFRNFCLNLKFTKVARKNKAVKVSFVHTILYNYVYYTREVNAFAFILS